MDDSTNTLFPFNSDEGLIEDDENEDEDDDDNISFRDLTPFLFLIALTTKDS